MTGPANLRAGLCGWEFLHQLETALSVHLDDPDRLDHVVVLGEAEVSERGFFVDPFECSLQELAVGRDILFAEPEAGFFGRFGQ